MKIRVSGSSYVMDLHKYVDVDIVEEQCENLMKEINHEFLNKTLEDWTLTFKIGYFAGGNIISVYTKHKSYVMDKEKMIHINISIPGNNTIAWGVHFDNPPPARTPKNSTILTVDFMDYKSLEEYIGNCIRKGIKQALYQGFTILGNKIQIKDFSFKLK